MRKSKKLLIVMIFLVLVVIVNSILSFALVSPGLTRVILHELEASDDYKSVVLGTSHGSYGINADIVSDQSGSKTMNLCIGGEYLQDSYYLLKKVFETNDPDTIVLDIDFQYLVDVPKNSISANFIYNSYPNSLAKLSYFKDKVLEMEYRATLFPWMDYRDSYSKVSSIIKTKLGSDYNNYRSKAVTMEIQDEYKGNGFIYRQRTDNLKKDIMKSLEWDDSMVDQESIEYLKKIIDLCNSNNTKIIMISTPVSVETINNSIEEFDQAYTYLYQLAVEYNIEYYNFSLVKETVFPRSIDDYWDYDGHLYGDAAERFSVVLGEFLNEVQNGGVPAGDYLYDSVWSIK